jgi:hypothetical protein
MSRYLLSSYQPGPNQIQATINAGHGHAAIARTGNEAERDFLRGPAGHVRRARNSRLSTLPAADNGSWSTTCTSRSRL